MIPVRRSQWPDKPTSQQDEGRCCVRCTGRHTTHPLLCLGVLCSLTFITRDENDEINGINYIIKLSMGSLWSRKMVINRLMFIFVRKYTHSSCCHGCCCCPPAQHIPRNGIVQHPLSVERFYVLLLYYSRNPIWICVRGKWIRLSYNLHILRRLPKQSKEELRLRKAKTREGRADNVRDKSKEDGCQEDKVI